MSVSPKLKVLVLGAGYGLLFATRVALGAHHVTVVCRADEAQLLNSEGPKIKIPVRGNGTPMLISRQSAALDITACTCEAVEPEEYDLVVLAMQEPHFESPDVNALMLSIARSGRPVISIMNMAAPPYLRRLDGVWHDALRPFYYAMDVWDAFSPENFTHSSPDPQAIRPDANQSNLIEVRLASNFKIAPFARSQHNRLLGILCKTSNLASTPHTAETKPRVHLLQQQTKFAPLAKWPMLVTGNYRCVTNGDPKSIAAAVADDAQESRQLYECTQRLCIALGAGAKTMVPYEAYANAARQLNAPSSVAKSLANGQRRIERMDKVVQFLLLHSGLANPALDRVVELVDSKIT